LPGDFFDVVKTAGAQQCGIENVGAVGRSHNDHAEVGFETIHLHQHLVQSLLTLVVTATKTRTTLAAYEFGRRIAFEDLATTGSLIAFDESRDIVAVVQNFIRFFEHESCGFCTPCRVGTTMLRRLVDRVMAGDATEGDLAEIEATSRVTRSLSHCGLGQCAPLSLLDALARFRPEFEAKLRGRGADPGFALEAALSEARALRAGEGADV
jgi:[NiFe] hydrogenase diaphorase moiety large subunit